MFHVPYPIIHIPCQILKFVFMINPNFLCRVLTEHSPITSQALARLVTYKKRNFLNRPTFKHLAIYIQNKRGFSPNSKNISGTYSPTCPCLLSSIAPGFSLGYIKSSSTRALALILKNHPLSTLPILTSQPFLRSPDFSLGI